MRKGLFAGIIMIIALMIMPMWAVASENDDAANQQNAQTVAPSEEKSDGEEAKKDSDEEEKEMKMISLEKALNEEVKLEDMTTLDYVLVIGGIALAFAVGFWARSFIRKRAEQNKFKQ